MRDFKDMKTIAKLWLKFFILIALLPLGLIIPKYFKSHPAWGEWDTNQIKALIGYVPRGMDKLSKLWKAPIPNYEFGLLPEEKLSTASLGYILSGIIGCLAIVIIIYLSCKFFIKDNDGK